MSDQLFEAERLIELAAAAPAIPDDLSAGRRLSAKRAAWIAVGTHPLANVMPGLRILPGGPTCRDCAHRIQVVGGNRRHHKCGFYASRSASSDLVLRWPACTRFVGKAD